MDRRRREQQRGTPALLPSWWVAREDPLTQWTLMDVERGDWLDFSLLSPNYLHSSLQRQINSSAKHITPTLLSSCRAPALCSHPQIQSVCQEKICAGCFSSWHTAAPGSAPCYEVGKWASACVYNCAYI